MYTFYAGRYVIQSYIVYMLFCFLKRPSKYAYISPWIIFVNLCTFDCEFGIPFANRNFRSGKWSSFMQTFLFCFTLIWKKKHFSYKFTFLSYIYTFSSYKFLSGINFSKCMQICHVLQSRMKALIFYLFIHSILMKTITNRVNITYSRLNYSSSPY